MQEFLKVYVPSGTDDTLRGVDFKEFLGDDAVYIYLNGKYYILECVTCSKGKTFLVAGKEIVEGEIK